MQTIHRIALALAALATLASCDSGPPLAPGERALPPDGPRYAAALFPAPAGFTATATGSTGPAVVLSWEDVPGDEGYLVQWRKGEAGTWTTLVSTSVNRTTYATDSVSHGQPNYYRVAVFTQDFRAGEFSTTLLAPRIETLPAFPFADTAVNVRARLYTHGSPVTYWFEWGTDSLLAGAAQTPVRSFALMEGRVAEQVAVVPGTRYYYRGVISNAGGTVRGEILRFNAGPPDAPTGVTATFSTAPLQIDPFTSAAAHHVLVQWTHDGNDVASWRLQRRSVGDATWVQVPEYAPPGPRSRIDQSFPVTADRVYDYRVLACHARDRCAASAEVRVGTQRVPAPAGFTATRQADGRVTLAWQDLSTEESYRVEWRAGETGSWQMVLSTSPNVTSYTTDRVTAGVTNYYRVAGEVRSFRAGAASGASVAAGAGRSLQVQTGGSTVPSSTSAAVSGSVTPNGLAATAWFEWGTDPALAGAAQTTARSVGAGVSPQPFADTLTVTSGQTYYYRAAASNSLGTVRGAIQSFQPGGPSAPAATAAFDLANYRIVVSWTHDGVGTPTRFLVERRTTGQTAWTQVRDVHVSQPRTYLDVSFPANAARAYDYRVRACNAADECVPSNVATVQTQPLSAPAGFTAAPAAGGQVNLTWQEITGEVAYLIQWRTDPAGPWKNVVSTRADLTQYATSSVTPGVTNYYRVAGEASGFRQGLFSETSIAVP